MSGDLHPDSPVPIERGRATTRDGWWQLVRAEDSVAPKRLTPAKFAALSEGEHAVYRRKRLRHHMNIPPINTTSVASALSQIMPILEGNALTQRRTAKQSVAISGQPHVGKTVLIEAIGKLFEKPRRDEYGWDVRTSKDGLYVPVVMVDLAERTRPVDFDKKLLSFLHAPVGTRATHADIGEAALDHLVRCGTQLVIVDDIHELRMSHEHGQQVNAKIKGIADATGVTFVVAGVDLESAQFLTEGKGSAKHSAAQTRRRFSLFDVEPYAVADDVSRGEWLALLAAIEQELVLVHSREGFLTDHWDLLFNRTQGLIGTVIALTQQVANAAILDGTERITEKGLATVRVNVAGESDAPADTRRLTARRRLKDIA